MENSASKDLGQRKTIQRKVTMKGGWSHMRGDKDMHTSGSDRVPVTINSQLFQQGDSVFIKVYFDIRETTGDHTEFRGTKVEKVYSAPKGKKLIDFDAPGGEVQNFKDETYGQNHRWNEIKQVPNLSFWRNLSFKVDTTSSNDLRYVGIDGNIIFSVILE